MHEEFVTSNLYEEQLTPQLVYFFKEENERTGLTIRLRLACSRQMHVCLCYICVFFVSRPNSSFTTNQSS